MQMLLGHGKLEKHDAMGPPPLLCTDILETASATIRAVPTTTATMPGSPNKLNRSAFLPNYPTHAHPPEFWDELGRTVATFGFLEDVLVKAYFAITGTTPYEWQTEEEAKSAVEKWGEQLALAMADTLVSLAQKYAASVRRNKTAKFPEIDALEASIKKAAESRNALCHGFWGMPDFSGKSELSYFSMPGKKVANLQKFEARIDVAWLRQLRAEAFELACDVIDSITVMGYQFPSSAGPGEPILKSKKS